MRKYDKKNKRNIGIILVISVVIIVIFSYFVFRFVSTSKIKYEVLATSILYDKDKNMMELDNDALVKVKWNSKYYLVYNDSNYLLGDNAVIYTPKNGSISLYGKFYDIKKDATVEIVDKQTVLESSVVSHFYKIADRKYLLVATTIQTEDKSLDTSNYLIVELDKLGNATLANNQVNLKTFSETVIKTNDYSFDVANEVLLYGEEKIDLKKIIGSTNEYSPEDLLVDGDNNGGTNGDGTGTGNGTGGGTGTGGGGGNNTTVIGPDNNAGDNDNNPNVEENITVAKRTSVIRVVPGITSISVDYVVYDPNEEYKSVYVEVINQSNNTSSRVQLNKKNTNINIKDLSPNTKYKLDFYCTYMEDNDLKENKYNSIQVTTKVPVISLALGDISSNSVGYKIDLDDKYSVSYVKLELLVGNEIKVTQEMKRDSKDGISSLSGSIVIPDGVNLSDGVVTIRITRIELEGISYNTDVYYKFSY